jgi:hypothetical protein
MVHTQVHIRIEPVQARYAVAALQTPIKTGQPWRRRHSARLCLVGGDRAGMPAFRYRVAAGVLLHTHPGRRADNGLWRQSRWWGHGGGPGSGVRGATSHDALALRSRRYRLRKWFKEQGAEMLPTCKSATYLMLVDKTHLTAVA